MTILSKVHVTEKQKEYLEYIIHTDGANSIGGKSGELGNAIQWCIDACMAIEKNYPEMDACYISFNDITKEGHPPFNEEPENQKTTK
jgi:hypothetical protein